jgi:hypothetical protein
VKHLPTIGILAVCTIIVGVWLVPFDLPPIVQRILTSLALVVVTTVLLMPRIGARILRQTPGSPVGVWLVTHGSHGVALLEEVAPYVPAVRRAVELLRPPPDPAEEARKAAAAARIKRILDAASKTGAAALCLALAGCTDLRPVVGVANGARTAGHAYVAVVERVCTVPAERAATLPEAEAAAEVERLRDLGCYQALHAQTDVAEAHRVMHDLIVAIQAGQCVATIARDVPASCDVRAAAERLADAGARLGAAVERLEGRAK